MKLEQLRCLGFNVQIPIFLREDWLKEILFLLCFQEKGYVATTPLRDEYLKEICGYSVKSISHNQEE